MTMDRGYYELELAGRRVPLSSNNVASFVAVLWRGFVPSVYEGKPKLGSSYNKEMRCPHKGIATEQQH
jgi:hypothetical protein